LPCRSLSKRLLVGRGQGPRGRGGQGPMVPPYGASVASHSLLCGPRLRAPRRQMSFVSFLEGCLQWDAAERFTPDSALRHEWLAELVSQPAAAAAGGGRSASGMDRPGTGGNRSARGGARSVAAAVSRPAVPTFAVGYAGERDAESARASARETAALSGGLAPLPSIGDVGVGSLGAVAGGPVRRAGRR
jgi:hypothetical protein